MLKNIVQIVKGVIICTVIVGFHCVYASITEEEISVGCNKDKSSTLVNTYAGEPDTRLSLITKGMRVAGVEEELITDWDEYKLREDKMTLDNPSVIAECIPYVNGERVFDVYGLEYGLMWPPGEAIVCKKGEGISIEMYTPNDENPKKYQYVATLIKKKDECEKNSKVIMVMSAGCLNQVSSMLKY